MTQVLVLPTVSVSLDRIIASIGSWSQRRRDSDEAISFLSRAKFALVSGDVRSSVIGWWITITSLAGLNWPRQANTILNNFLLHEKTFIGLIGDSYGNVKSHGKFRVAFDTLLFVSIEGMISYKCHFKLYYLMLIQCIILFKVS